ncbi:hypothetical protein F441_02156 [Phytophthora nicotianae CJ01A1]|uniref:Uncharacterized protein n=2 Tax=Phytophthora nicotianae TaxID=4792 RepID=W2XQY9_PHYNI|nr:hypothetical protein F444_00220 [Phytophthora nicotianae P1976]ETP24927.1 hypothetical protein F441_02156 [Phytophthora nicotianae CJ01A1]
MMKSFERDVALPYLVIIPAHGSEQRISECILILKLQCGREASTAIPETSSSTNFFSAYEIFL